MRPPTLACLTAYRGDLFHGFARQGELPTVELALRRAIAAATGRDPIALAVAGRTDAGVHARAQVVSFRLIDPPPPAALRSAINARLPPGVLIRGCARVSPRFHARSCALTKRYRYRIERAAGDPNAQRRAWRLDQPLDLDAMTEAAAALIGRHDFAGFRSGDAVGLSICRVDAVRLRARGPLILVDLEADRFLRRMARAMVGLLVEVGSGARPIAPIVDWRASGVLATRPRVAPARGLYLQRVRYAAGLFEVGVAIDGSTTPAISSRPEATVSTLSAIWA